MVSNFRMKLSIQWEIVVYVVAHLWFLVMVIYDI